MNKLNLVQFFDYKFWHISKRAVAPSNDWIGESLCGDMGRVTGSREMSDKLISTVYMCRDCRKILKSIENVQIVVNVNENTEKHAALIRQNRIVEAQIPAYLRRLEREAA